MKLIVGLGNPGKKYDFTKHNMGFIAVDAYAKKHLCTFTFDKKFQGELYKTTNYILLKPLTYMNLSGESIRQVMDYFQIPLDDILVIYDDLAIPFGNIRIRQKGSAGGHNGLKSVINHVHSQEFKRVRLGIDMPYEMNAKDFVLSKFHKKDHKTIEEVMDKTVQVIEEFIEDTAFEKIMTKYNG